MIFYFNKKRGGRPCFFCGVFYVFLCVLCIVCAGRRGRCCCNEWWFFFVVVCAWMCVVIGLFLGWGWAWADFVMCDRRGGFICALFSCIACIFYRRGTSAKGGTQKAHNVSTIMLSFAETEHNLRYAPFDIILILLIKLNSFFLIFLIFLLNFFLVIAYIPIRLSLFALKFSLYFFSHSCIFRIYRIHINQHLILLSIF